MSEYISNFSRFYTSFLMRDLTYTVAGGILSGASYFPWIKNIEINELSLKETVILLILFYFSGLFSQQLFAMLKVVRLNPGDYSEGFFIKPLTFLFSFFYDSSWEPSNQLKEEYYSKWNFLFENCHSGVLLMIERIIYLKHLGAALGSASVLALFVFDAYALMGMINIQKPYFIFFNLVSVVIIFFLLQFNWRCWRSQMITIEQLLRIPPSFVEKPLEE